MNSHINDIEQFSAGLTPAQGGCIWVPSDKLVLHHVPVPNAPKRKWTELVPWMLEDKLLQSPEELHFVIAGREQGNLCVLACAKSQLEHWIKTVKAKGVQSFQLVPDYMALPWSSGSISIAKQSENILVRYGEIEGFAAKPGLAWHMVKALLQDEEQELTLSICIPQSELPEQLQNTTDIVNSDLDWQTPIYPKNVNLLTGEFAQATTATELVPWMKTAALFVLALGLSLSALSLDNSRLQEQVNRLNEQNRASFYNQFPGLSIRSGDIRTTLESYISDRFRQRESLQSDAMQMLMELDSALSSCNCGLQGLSWRNNSLELTLPQATAESIELLNIEGYQKQISNGTEDTLILTLSRVYER